MKKILLTILVALAANINTWGQTDDPILNHHVMTVELRNGKKHAISLANQPTIMDTEALVTIAYTEGDKDFSISLQREDINEINFSADPTAIDEIANDPSGNAIGIDAHDLNHIRITGLSAKDRVQVVSVSGVAVPPAVRQTKGEAVVSLGTMPRGTYIIRASRDCSFKIMKR